MRSPPLSKHISHRQGLAGIKRGCWSWEGLLLPPPTARKAERALTMTSLFRAMACQAVSSRLGPPPHTPASRVSSL